METSNYTLLRGTCANVECSADTVLLQLAGREGAQCLDCTLAGDYGMFDTTDVVLAMSEKQ